MNKTRHPEVVHPCPTCHTSSILPPEQTPSRHFEWSPVAGALSFSTTTCQPSACRGSTLPGPAGHHQNGGRSERRPLLWPHFMELWPYMEIAFSDPRKALVSHYKPFTRVHRDMEHSFPAGLPLDQSLATILLPRETFFSRHKPDLPSPRDQVYAHLSDCSHQYATQVAAATNNIMLLSSTVSATATKPGALSPELATDLSLHLPWCNLLLRKILLRWLRSNRLRTIPQSGTSV
eukprot:superscaffoldBa00000098_g1440